MTDELRANVAKPTQIKVRANCSRCGGDGVWKGGYRGTCFRCGGTGTDPTPDKVFQFPVDWTDEQIDAFYVERNERLRKARERRQEKARVKADAMFAQNVERFPALAVDDTVVLGGFALDVWHKAHRFELTDKQGAAFADALVRDAAFAAERAAAEAAKRPAPVGRTVVVGAVVGRKFHDSQYGGEMKITIAADDGYRVWVTEPRSITTEVGDRVELSADLWPSEDDETFAFGKRPTKAKVLSEAPSE